LKLVLGRRSRRSLRKMKIDEGVKEGNHVGGSSLGNWIILASYPPRKRAIFSTIGYVTIDNDTAIFRGYI